MSKKSFYSTGRYSQFEWGRFIVESTDSGKEHGKSPAHWDAGLVQNKPHHGTMVILCCSSVMDAGTTLEQLLSNV